MQTANHNASPMEIIKGGLTGWIITVLLLNPIDAASAPMLSMYDKQVQECTSVHANQSCTLYMSMKGCVCVCNLRVYIYIWFLDSSCMTLRSFVRKEIEIEWKLEFIVSVLKFSNFRNSHFPNQGTKLWMRRAALCLWVSSAASSVREICGKARVHG